MNRSTRPGNGLRVFAAALATACAWFAGSASAWTLEEAAKPYAGTKIRVLDEITPLQESMKSLVPEFIARTGIQVEYELLNHFEVINKGQADMLSRRGFYDAVMLHGMQMGQMLAARVIEPIDGFMKNPALANPSLDLADMIEPANTSFGVFKGNTYGFLNWNYNMVYWARADLLEHPGEQAAFKARYGYDLGPAKTLQQFLDIGEFFTRKAGEQLAGETLKSDFYGILHEGITGGATIVSVWDNLMKNFGGDLFDAEGAPAFDSPANVAALEFWAKMWAYSPPGQAEYSLVDVPTVMGNGIAAQAIAYSDFVLGIDKPGGSPFAGRFTYAGIPRNPDFTGQRGAGAEPSGIVINRASKNKEATFLFMQWMIDKETQAKLVEAGAGGVPIRRSSFDLPQFAGARSALYSAMRDTFEVALSKPRAPKIFEIYDALGPLLQQVGQGRLAPADAARQGQQKMIAICTSCLL